MKRSKILYKVDLKDCQEYGFDVKLATVGVFETDKVNWKYYVVSYYKNNDNLAKTSTDICGRPGEELTNTSVERYGKEFKTSDECKEFIDTYKIKWETGSNSTLEEKRDKKLSQLLDDEDEKS